MDRGLTLASGRHFLPVLPLAPSFAAIVYDDIHCPADTARSVLLLSPTETTTQGWVREVAYTATIDFTDTGSTVTVIRDSDQATIADFFVADTTFTSGYFGATTDSQLNACIGPLTAECL